MQLPNYFRKWVTGEKILTQNQVKCYRFYDGHIDCLDLFFSFLDAFQFLQSLFLSLTESHCYSLTLSLSFHFFLRLMENSERTHSRVVEQHSLQSVCTSKNQQHFTSLLSWFSLYSHTFRESVVFKQLQTSVLKEVRAGT